MNNTRLATLKTLRQEILPNFLQPIPTDSTLRTMFDRARVPRFQTNPLARRGGGQVFYAVAAIEKLFKAQTLPPIR